MKQVEAGELSWSRQRHLLRERREFVQPAFARRAENKENRKPPESWYSSTSFMVGFTEMEQFLRDMMGSYWSSRLHWERIQRSQGDSYRDHSDLRSPPIDGQFDPSDETAVIRGKEENGFRNFARIAKPPTTASVSRLLSAARTAA
jgi:hypothetical protein